MPACSDITVPNNSSPISHMSHGNQSTYAVPSSFKAGLPSLNFQTKMFSAELNEKMGQITKAVADLKNPLSPASFPSITSEVAIEERLFEATASVKILTAQVAMYMEKNWRDKLFGQIDSLHDVDEWDTDDKPVKKSSFSTFLKAILKIKPQRHPGLGLTYEGNMIAAWTVGHDRLTTEFLPRDRVQWVLSRNIDGETERAAGETTVSRLYECLTPYDPNYWFFA